MSIDPSRDPREILAREKYFTLRPKPLERWLWQQGLPQAAERVFWLHWEEGMRRRDWCSELSLRQVARECCIDTSTVTRAYQLLKSHDLIRREDPGRDPSNPFQQAIAITEVRIPRPLLTELSRSPNRSAKRHDPAQPLAASNPLPLQAPTVSDSPTTPILPAAILSAAPSATPPEADPALPNAPAPGAPHAPQATQRLTRAESSALMQKLSATERSEFFLASRDRRSSMKFDEPGSLTPDERGRVLTLLAEISRATPGAPPASSQSTTGTRSAAATTASAAAFAKPRHLSPLEAARLRKSVLTAVPHTDGPEVFRQVLWSVEEGALRRFEPRLAINIALKKIREGAWTRPNRMPPNWLRPAAPETCNAA
jgi:hypothetical protein